MEWKIESLGKKKIDLNNPILIEGLPGIGNVGKIAVDYLIEEFKAKKLCSFFSYNFPNSVFVNADNLIEMPKIELYYKKFKDKRDLLILTGDIQPIDEKSCYLFCEKILDLLDEYNVKEIITTGGIGLTEVPENPQVYVTANNPETYKSYAQKKYKSDQAIFGVVGPIMGVSGILLGMSKKRNIPGVALLAQTLGHPMYLGVKGAKEILKIINLKFKYGLKVKKISEEILELEKELAKKTEMLSKSITKKNDPHYIG
jgi:uncharacterized protein